MPNKVYEVVRDVGATLPSNTSSMQNVGVKSNNIEICGWTVHATANPQNPDQGTAVNVEIEIYSKATNAGTRTSMNSIAVLQCALVTARALTNAFYGGSDARVGSTSEVEHRIAYQDNDQNRQLHFVLYNPSHAPLAYTVSFRYREADRVA